MNLSIAKSPFRSGAALWPVVILEKLAEARTGVFVLPCQRPDKPVLGHGDGNGFTPDEGRRRDGARLPALIQILDNLFTTAQLGDALLAAQALQDDAVLLFCCRRVARRMSFTRSPKILTDMSFSE
jgi:hypothetical protein